MPGTIRALLLKALGRNAEAGAASARVRVLGYLG